MSEGQVGPARYLLWLGAGIMRLPDRRNLSVVIFLIGAVAISYTAGAAVMFFELPTSSALSKAFIGARAWNERAELSAAPSAATPTTLAGGIDQPDKTFDGFTLIATSSTSESSTRAYLLNMRRQLVHRWEVPFSRVWPNPPHLSAPVDDSFVGFFACHLYSNGDLLVVFQSLERFPNGYGLAKLDKDSNVLWKYAARVHHDLDVGEDGVVYAITEETATRLPAGLDQESGPYKVDSLVMLSPDGKELKKPIPILEAIHASPYRALLGPLEVQRVQPLPGSTSAEDSPSTQGLTGTTIEDKLRRQDLIHGNSVHVLRRDQAARFPGLRAGHVLLSLRRLDALVALDPEIASVVWAARGPWRAQHDAQFLDNGHLLIFDNKGSASGSRVLEYDPLTQSIPWIYPGENNLSFFSNERGQCQRLPNGNTLIINSSDGKIIEVSSNHEIVWTCFVTSFISTAKRFDPNYISFLKRGQHARP